MRRLLLLLVATALTGMAVMAAPAGEARANGVPQLVKLSYLDGISNFGPRDAEGVLEFSFAEAYVRVDVKKLIPAAGTTYEGWLVAPSGAALLVGEIPISAAGVGGLQTKLTGLTRYDYNLFVIAARGSGAAGAIPAQKSIAGRFTVLADNNARNGDTRPSTLPDAGEAPDNGLAGRIIPTALVTLAASVAAAAWYRWNRRKNARD